MDVGILSKVSILSKVNALFEARELSKVRDPSENGLSDHPVVDGAENAAKTRGTLEKYHRPIGQETSSSEEGEVLAQVIITKEGIEPHLVTITGESQAEEHSQAEEEPAPVETAL